MEDVLSVYKRPDDPRRPQLCVDEMSKQLVGEVRPALALGPGHPSRQDHEYVRQGVVNLFMVAQPLTGRIQVKVTSRRTKIDWAELMKTVVDDYYPAAGTMVLVQDNLNTHDKSSLYEAFPPAEAKRIADQLEIHYTPKHGSWLNIAECELSVLNRQYRDRRLPDLETLTAEVEQWTADRNQNLAPVVWHFTTEKARIKLKRLYPTLQN